MNFNKKGNSFNTVLGGTCSIILNISMVYLLVLYSTNTFSRNLDDFQETSVITDFSDGPIFFDETEQVISLRIRSETLGDSSKIMSEIERYVSFYVQEATINNTESETKKMGPISQMVPCSKKQLEKVGKSLKSLHNSYCVNNLGNYSLLNTEEVHDESLELHRNLNLIIGSCNSTIR